MFTFKLKRRFFPGYKTFKVQKFVTVNELDFGDKKVPIPPRIELSLVDGSVYVIGDINNREFHFIWPKGMIHAIPETSGRAGSSS